MINNYEQLKDFVTANQERILRDDIVCREKAQEGPTFDDFIKKRIDDNLKKIEDIGVVELFQRIKSENLLGGHVNVMDGSLEEFKKLKSRDYVSNYVPHFKGDREKWSRFLDRSIIVRLMWDPRFSSDITTGCDTTTYRQIVVFVDEGKPVLVYSTGMCGSKPNAVDSHNLFNLTTEALLKASRTDLDLDPMGTMR